MGRGRVSRSVEDGARRRRNERKRKRGNKRKRRRRKREEVGGELYTRMGVPLKWCAKVISTPKEGSSDPGLSGVVVVVEGTNTTKHLAW